MCFVLLNSFFLISYDNNNNNNNVLNILICIVFYFLLHQDNIYTDISYYYTYLKFSIKNSETSKIRFSEMIIVMHSRERILCLIRPRTILSLPLWFSLLSPTRNLKYQISCNDGTTPLRVGVTSPLRHHPGVFSAVKKTAMAVCSFAFSR